MSDTDSRINEAKEVEYYAAAVSAWLTTRFELDKSLLTLSTAGIGLIITLISTVGVRSIESLILSLLTMVCFLITLICVLSIFGRNAKYIQATISGSGPTSDPFLASLDRIAVVSFMGGVILAAIIGISTAANAYIDKAAKMSENPKPSVLQISQESLDMFALLRPAQVQAAQNQQPQVSPAVKSAPIVTSQAGQNGPSTQNQK